MDNEQLIFKLATPGSPQPHMTLDGPMARSLSHCGTEFKKDNCTGVSEEVSFKNQSILEIQPLTESPQARSFVGG